MDKSILYQLKRMEGKRIAYADRAFRPKINGYIIHRNRFLHYINQADKWNKKIIAFRAKFGFEECK